MRCKKRIVQLCLILFVEVQKLYENEATEENQYEPSVYDPMTFFVGMAVPYPLR
jgi:hypothetical protein